MMTLLLLSVLPKIEITEGPPFDPANPPPSLRIDHAKFGAEDVPMIGRAATGMPEYRTPLADPQRWSVQVVDKGAIVAADERYWMRIGIYEGRWLWYVEHRFGEVEVKVDDVVVYTIRASTLP